MVLLSVFFFFRNGGSSQYLSIPYRRKPGYDHEISDFTVLPGVHRFLMMQNGSADLTWEDGRRVVLRPYEVFEFDGGEKIHCHGTGTDLNLMLCGDHVGRLQCLILPAGDSRLISPEYSQKLIKRAVYIVRGHGIIVSDGEELSGMNAAEGDTILAEEENEFKLISAWTESLTAAVFFWN